jgi:hypothetical protein
MNWINSKEKQQNLLFIWAEIGRPKSEIVELLLLGHGGGGRPADSGGDRRQGGPGRGARATRHDGETAGGALERRAQRRGSFHRGAARPEGNGRDGRRLVVVVGISQFGKVARVRAVIGLASMKREGSR